MIGVCDEKLRKVKFEAFKVKLGSAKPRLAAAPAQLSQRLLRKRTEVNIVIFEPAQGSRGL